MIYFIQAQGGPIKIGFTQDEVTLIRRIEALRICNYDKLFLLATIDGDYEDEWIIHKRFAPFRIRGEWFSPTIPLLRFIENVMEMDGVELAQKLRTYDYSLVKSIKVRTDYSFIGEGDVIDRLGGDRIIDMGKMVLAGNTFNYKNFAKGDNLFSESEMRWLVGWLEKKNYVKKVTARRPIIFTSHGEDWLQTITERGKIEGQGQDNEI